MPITESAMIQLNKKINDGKMFDCWMLNNGAYLMIKFKKHSELAYKYDEFDLLNE